MRRYFLAKQDSRRDVDLRDYAQSIRDAVGKVLPNAEVVVTKQWYSVSPTPDKGAAIKIGRILSSKDILGKYCIHVPKLFNSIAIENKKEENNDTAKHSHHGGHQ